ncbi:MAG: Ppx/GppA phosphatase family protein [Chloroflexota bacterium]
MPNDPIPEGRVKAFIDIGTNSIRILVVRITPNHSYAILNDEKETVRLGENEFEGGVLQREAMQRAATVCRHFVEMARAYEAKEILAVATSATREARNKEEFLDLVKQQAGLDVHTISGKEEARLIYLGVSSGINLKGRRTLFIDIGGGSTELIVGGQTEYEYLDSLKLGAIRLTTQFFLPQESSPVSDERYALIERFVRSTSVRAVQQIEQFHIEQVYGSSGTIENLADIAMQHFHGRKRERDDRLTRAQLDEVVDVLRSLPLEKRRQLPGINPARADIIIGGAAILQTLMHDLNLNEIAVTDRGLRDGLLIDSLLKSEDAGLVSGLSVRERSVLQLGRACRFEEAHARHVARLALQLFDSAGRAKLHSLGARERELFQYAALLHDIGTFLNHVNHNAHTYYLIKNADLLGFDEEEINIMATVGFFHRKIYPDKGHPEFAALGRKSRETVRTLALFLQLAESLDRRHTGIVQNVSLRMPNRESALLKIQATQDCQMEVWGVQNQKKAFRKAFGRRLEVRAITPDD